MYWLLRSASGDGRLRLLRLVAALQRAGPPTFRPFCNPLGKATSEAVARPPQAGGSRSGPSSSSGRNSGRRPMRGEPGCDIGEFSADAAGWSVASTGVTLTSAQSTALEMPSTRSRRGRRQWRYSSRSAPTHEAPRRCRDKRNCQFRNCEIEGDRIRLRARRRTLPRMQSYTCEHRRSTAPLPHES